MWGHKVKEVAYRYFRSPYCYENDLDVIAVMNLYGRVSLALSTAPTLGM
ncbi:hypothetical protein [Metallosphaera tengchongensis]|nr:hypothetical protein [Metallosphaera tengchongensis]